MTNDSRKLMPYEHQLVEALGITKDEYLDFVAQQEAYSDIKEGTVFDIRNDAAGTVALILTIVGTILQVVAALLARPEEGGRRQSRDDIFAPRSGFSSSQELASYGDPINLVYTNSSTNPNGGVRVNTSLIWSAIKSFGSSQYVQLLLLIGAGGIGRIDYERTAFGQTPVRDLIAQNYWLYFDPDDTGRIAKRNLEAGGDQSRDPGAIGGISDNIYRVVSADSPSRVVDGFSHAISPATSNTFGVYAPVALNVNILMRKPSGKIDETRNQIEASGLGTWGKQSPNGASGRINKGDRLTITLSRTRNQYDSEVEEEAAEFRRTVSSAFDNAGTMKLGSAKFAISSINRGSTEDGDMVVSLVCTESGRAPSVPYGATAAKESARKLANNDPEYEALKKEVDKLLDEDERGGVPISRIASLGIPSMTTAGSDFDTAEGLLKDGRIFTKETYESRAPFNQGGRTTKVRFVFKRKITDKEKRILRDFIQYEKTIASGRKADDLFFIKALVKIETAHYETLTPCHAVEFAIKARVWRRISGRQERYGTKQKEGYPSTDNGLKRRSSMFTVKYKKANSSSSSYVYVQGIFVVSRAAEVDNFIYFRFDSGNSGLGSADLWQFEIEPIHDPIAEFASHPLATSNNKYRYFYLENSGFVQKIDLGSGRSITFTGEIRESSNKLPPLNRSPIETNQWDLFSNTADTQLQMSFDQGPEFAITAVTEQIRESFGSFNNLYQDLSLMGFNMYSGRNVQDLRALSVFVEQGRRSRLLRTSGTVNNIPWGQPGYQYLSPLPNGYANMAPDIFIDTILDDNDGIGKYAGDLFSIDLEQLARSKKFCEYNRLFMDGVIAEPVSWRQFWADNAGFSLLELAKKDGKESLVPALPYDEASGQISRQVKISALFNPGNILEDSYREEFIDYGNNAEDVIVTVVYRENEREGVFPRNTSVDIMLADVREEDAFRETIDASAFVTRRQQAILIGKFLCQTRRHSRRAIEFKTFPTDSFVAPGSYIYVELAQNRWNRIQTGTIGEGGTLNLPFGEAVSNGQYQMLLYNPTMIEQKTIYRTGEVVVSGTAPGLRNFVNYVFVLGQAIKTKRVFRVTEVSMDEEGEVTIKGVEHGTNAEGESAITRGLAEFAPGLFLIDGRRE